MNHTSAPTFWITGGHGMLGTRLAADAAKAGFHVVVTGHEVDIGDRAVVDAFVSVTHPRVIVNCAAYTAVDKAESEVHLAEHTNVVGPGVLSAAAARVSATMVHVSTDYVFGGTGSTPLTEQAPTAPTSVYGRTKRDGEQAVLAANDRALVVRTSWLYAATHKNFVRTMLSLMATREQLRVVGDQRGRPTSTATLSAAIINLVGANARGIVHVADDAGPAGISWYDFAVAIRDEAAAAGLPLVVKDIEAIPTSAYPTPAVRPAWSVFDTSRYTALTGRALPAWRDTLRTVVAAVAADARAKPLA